MLQQLDHLPPSLLEREARELARILGGPTLIQLPGERFPPLFVSILLHGNETVGWDAVRAFLVRQSRNHPGRPLPRALSLFIGNVAAAAEDQRSLDGQPDYNRVWPGSELPPTAEHQLMADVVRITAERGLFASLDIHNNTGWNPHYACVNRLDPPFLHLGALFSRTLVYFLRPKGVQSMAMAALAPAVTLECGKVGSQQGVTHAADYLDACIHLAHLPERPLPFQDVDLYRSIAQVRVPEGVGFRFDGEAPATGIHFAPDLDRLNFQELPPGTLLGQVKGDKRVRLEVQDEQDQEVTERYLEIVNGEIRLRVAVTPAMLTRNERIIRQDCLCYLMERYDQHLQCPARTLG